MASSSSHLTVDLHIHSTASDGSLPPGEILARACKTGLAAISITDHDTVDGVRAALAAGIPDDLGFVTGVEISAAPHPAYPCQGSLHILGYGIAIDHAGLAAQLTKLQKARESRNPTIIAKLNRLGIDITLTEVLEASGTGQSGRPHIATVMVQKGYATDVDDAFDRYLGTGKPAYVDKYRTPCADAIAMIREAGGAAVLAHPGLIQPVGDWSLEAMVTVLTDMNLEGIEVYYPEHGPLQTRALLDLADRLGLLVTGGTDFHGDIKPEIEIGRAPGGFTVPIRCFQNLEATVRQRKPAGKSPAA